MDFGNLTMPTIASFPSYSIANNTDMIMFKLDENGNYIWSQQIGALDAKDEPTDLDLDAIGNIYIAGYYKLDATNISGIALPVNTSGGEFFIAKYSNSGGSAIWARSSFGVGVETSSALAVDANGSIFVAIQNKSNNISPIGSCFSFSNQNLINDDAYYVVKYKSNGAVDWAVSAITDDATNIYGPAQIQGIGANTGNSIVLTGNLVGTSTFGSTSLSGNHSFFSKLAATPLIKPPSICAGSNVTLTPAFISTGLNYNFYISNTAPTPVFTGTSFTTPNLNTNTFYYVSAILANGCESERVPVLVTVKPYATITATSTQVICSGTCANISFTSNTGGVSIYNGALLIGNYTSSPITTICPSVSTNYTVKSKSNINFCESSVASNVVVIACRLSGESSNNSSINKPSIFKLNNSSIFPNPNSGDRVTVSLSELSSEPKTIEISLYDAFGKQLQSYSFSNPGDQQINTELKFKEAYAEGVYFINVSIDGLLVSKERISIIR
jgi:hypothetical protein